MTEPLISPYCVYLIDDDPLIRKSMERLFLSYAIPLQTFATAQEFLELEREDVPECLILDLELPGIDGIEVQQELIHRHSDLPVVFLTGHGDIPTSVQAIRAGALDFLTKPVEPSRLIEVVRESIQQHIQQREQNSDVRDFCQRLEGLSPREHEVMLLAIDGLLNKQIARRLGITERTVKEHRGRVMKKLNFESIAQLSRMCERSGIASPEEDCT